MLDTIIKIAVALLVFGIIIFIHELGHFLLAKKNGIGVVEFALGMGPKLASREKNGTIYSIRALPIGGFCNMVGEDEESDAEDAFNKKSVWARISVIAAGAIFNFILAWVFAIIIISSVGYSDNTLGIVDEKGAAYESGIRVGDRVTKMNDTKIRIYSEIMLFSQLNQDKPVTIEYSRDGKKDSVLVTPKKTEAGYKIGVANTERVKGNTWKVLQYSVYEVRYWIETTYKSLAMMIRGQVSTKDIAGPVGIVNMIGDSYEAGKEDGGIFYVIMNLSNMVILLSANLGVINLLPLPALDGGRLVFLVIEAIRGKPIDPEKEGQVHLVGMVLLMILMLLVVFNDVSKLIG